MTLHAHSTDVELKRRFDIFQIYLTVIKQGGSIYSNDYENDSEITSI